MRVDPEGQDRKEPEALSAARDRPSATPRYAPLSARALIIGLALSPLLIFWGEYTEIVAEGTDLLAMSLIMAVVAPLLVIIALNVAVRRFAPGRALSQAELLFIYVLNSTSIGISGIGMMQFLNPTLAGAYYFATPENRWANWMRFIRPWAVPDERVVAAYYAGQSSFFTREHMLGWLTPILVWSAFIFALLFCMYCIGTLLRRQWADRERLLFPIVIIPLEITRNGGATPLWRSRPLWCGFAIACLLETLAALHDTVNPGIPFLPIKPSEPALDMGQYLTVVPWNGVGTLMLGFYPLVIGLTYLLSLDVAFSCWFFYLVLKTENVLAVALGFHDAGAGPAVAGIPYSSQQAVGAFLGLALLSLASARPHLKAAFRTAFFHRARSQDGPGRAEDRDEPMSYRAAYLGLFASLLFLVGFGIALGLPWYVALLFFALFFLFGITFARIRAEAGIPWGYGPPPMAHGTLVEMGGSENYNAQTLVAFSYLHWFDTDIRGLALPAQMEAMKLAESARMNPRHLTVGVLIAVVWATLGSWVSVLGIYYHYGAASAHVNPWRTGQGEYGFDQIQGWLNNPKQPDTPMLTWGIGGLLVTVALSVLRSSFVWWPLNPIGYAIANTGTMDWLWCSMLVGWLCKWATLRYGGLGAYRKALPFFFGLVLGDYAISAFLALFSLATGSPGYRTFPN